MPRDEDSLPEPGDATAREQVIRLQRDGLALLTFLAERPGRALVETSARELDKVDPGLMIAEPAEIAADPARFGALVRSVDLLGRAAAPATATSIRLTRAYLFGPQPGITPREARRARRLRFCVLGIQAGLLLAGLAAIFLLLKAEEGRRIVGQLAMVRTDLERSYGALWKLDRQTDFELRRFYRGEDAPIDQEDAATRRAALTTLEMCWPVDPSNAGVTATEYRLLPVKPQAQTLCSDLAQQQKREMLVYARLAAWNCDMMRLNPLNWRNTPLPWSGRGAADPCGQPPAELLPSHAADWRRTELRTNEAVQGLSGYLLPLLLGGIGGGVYVLRRMDELLRSSTLTARDGMAAVGRIVLAAVFGGLLALVFGTDEPVKLGSFSLTIAAWAFFLGYALETVLRTLDAAIEGVVGRLRPAEMERKTVPVAPLAAPLAAPSPAAPGTGAPTTP
ncbi:hypothetical protein [Roseicella sp. DB1501]|uniref:hypothetical protein n=1 Tax=Roseicella sp. DB1501 TaxID=2730925 RepID=UPI001492AE24|nr:hypothetical protein [Roseicella sp. DB1501]NOG70236.1 hypothetical protein [Roseicella sp. DB1501]